MNSKRIFGILSVFLLLGLLTTTAQAKKRPMGPTRTVRHAISAETGITSTQIRFRTNKRTGEIRWRDELSNRGGDAERKMVNGDLKITNVRETAGPHHKVAQPRRVPRKRTATELFKIAQQMGRGLDPLTLEDACGYPVGTAGHEKAVTAAGFHRHAAALVIKSGAARRTSLKYKKYWRTN